MHASRMREAPRLTAAELAASVDALIAAQDELLGRLVHGGGSWSPHSSAFRIPTWMMNIKSSSSKRDAPAMDRRFVTDCLQHYNSLHPGIEYEPAPGRVTRHFRFHNGMCWTHGNFVARRKRSGFFSFLPGPRTLFFFELAYRNGSNGIVTCTPLDEPVTEAYSVLGFPLWWSTRRNGKNSENQLIID
ncbi:hypothetical protein U9M48_041149, partial [Paspalum notatum var. saurae]